MSTAETVRNMKLLASIQGLLTASPGVSQSVNESKATVFSDGTGSGKAGNILYYSGRSLNSTNEDVNFTTALDFQGDALGASKIMALYVKYDTGDAGTFLTMKQPASNGVAGIFLASGDGIKIPVGEALLLTNSTVGWTVTASTGDLLNFTTTCTATYTLVVVVQ